jgi:hypothetical protein
MYGEKNIQFDMLIRSAAAGTATVSQLDSYCASEADIEYCRGWLTERRVVCHPTSFGLACEAEAPTFAELFGSTLDPRPPDELADRVEQITLVRPPDFFAGE